jgi:hypothetical protein
MSKPETIAKQLTSTGNSPLVFRTAPAWTAIRDNIPWAPASAPEYSMINWTVAICMCMKSAKPRLSSCQIRKRHSGKKKKGRCLRSRIKGRAHPESMPSRQDYPHHRRRAYQERQKLCLNCQAHHESSDQGTSPGTQSNQTNSKYRQQRRRDLAY